MKGIINENICDVLNLRPLDEVLKEKGVNIAPAPEPVDENTQRTVEKLRDVSAKINLMEGTDHAESMDDLHNEIVQHARELMTYGFNIDSPRARGIFEVAATMYGHALSAKNSKREWQVKSMKLAIERKKLELDEKKVNHVIGAQVTEASDTEGTILVEDRNELLRRVRAEMAQAKA